jgi:predicted murein hydrolase (TIGR00659 family)
MQDFVQLWVYLSATPLFGLTATLVAYLAAHAFYQRTGQAPWANPVLWTVLLLAALLLLSHTPYPSYFSGAQFIHFLLGPAVVALAWPLWQRRAELQARVGPLLIAALVGGAAASGSAVALGWLLGLPPALLRSLAPKSVTAPVAMGIAEQIGGVPALAAVFAVLTGLVGAISGKYLFDALAPLTPCERGFALGTASHGLGAARAMQVHPDAGAYAALALGMQVILAALLMPLVARLLQAWF